MARASPSLASPAAVLTRVRSSRAAQLAFLARQRLVHAVLTEDSDLVAYCLPRVLVKLDRQNATAQLVEKERLMQVTKQLHLNLSSLSRGLPLSLPFPSTALPPHSHLHPGTLLHLRRHSRRIITLHLALTL